eukprot:Skav212943  [mRNA]  locus=scaffold374:499856:502796:- [translate_table: standard]
MLQRFISIFCPLNAVSRKIEGEESTLPYLGQLNLLQIPDEACILVDSEDLQSAFNLFEMPKGWRGLFCYQKQVRGRVLGLESDELVYVSLRTVPMGWISAVGVVQRRTRSIQGGELMGEEGVYMLHPKKMQQNIACCLAMLAAPKWDQKRISGLVGRLVFAGSFRRPLLAVLSDVFHHFGQAHHERRPTDAAFDEVLGMIGLLPFAFTNLRAKVDPALHATDASPTGAGSCVAKQIKRKPGTCSPNDLQCDNCRRDISEEISRGEEFDCPKRCGKHFCSIDCYCTHRSECHNRRMVLPVFSERWSGPNAPLTQAMLRQGFDVVAPYDWERNERMDFFSREGKEHWNQIAEEDPEYEHHAPDCKTFSRARGKPFWIGQRRFQGPPALRDERNTLGFSNLRGDDAAKVRQGNRMALASAKRCTELDEQGKYFSYEHPYRSWVWYTKALIALASRPGVYMAVFSNCCHGGRRQKWTSVLTNNRALFEALHRPECEHGPGDDYAPYYVGSKVVFPTEEEAEYQTSCALPCRRILRNPAMRHCRLMVVVDSQVLYYALGKGRSASVQLNRVLRRLMALQAYRRALQGFFSYLQDTEEEVPHSYRKLDTLLSIYIEHLWMDDHPITYAGHLMSGLRRFLPEARWRVPRPKQFFSNWQSTHVSKQAAPAPPEVAMAFAGLALKTHQPALACVFLLGYLAFLRTGEMVALTPAKLAVDLDTGRILLALPSTKTSRQRKETVCVTDLRLAKLVSQVLARQGQQSFWPGSLNSFRAMFAQFCAFFDLEEWEFTPYSIRRGGASYAFAEGASFDELLIRGRWQSNRAARLYLDTGRAALIQTRFTARQRFSLDKYVSHLTSCCEQLR